MTDWSAIQAIAVTVVGALAFITSSWAILESRKERRHNFIRLQMEELYNPLFELIDGPYADGFHLMAPVAFKELNKDKYPIQKKIRKLLSSKIYLGGREMKIATIKFFRLEQWWNSLDDGDGQKMYVGDDCAMLADYLESVIRSDYKVLLVECQRIASIRKLDGMMNGHARLKAEEDIDTDFGSSHTYRLRAWFNKVVSFVEINVVDKMDNRVTDLYIDIKEKCKRWSKRRRRLKDDYW